MKLNRFLHTRQYDQFCEMCNACRDNQFIGLCYGAAGVGKTVSAKTYSNWDEVSEYFVRASSADAAPHRNSIFYTAPVVNGPGQTQRAIDALQSQLRSVSAPIKAIENDFDSRLREARLREAKERKEWEENRDWIESFSAFPRSKPTLEDLLVERRVRDEEINDPTRLLIIDEADRLKQSTLEQVRDYYDRGRIGVVLIGMPGMEKRMSRYPQLYSRVGFVYEFSPLTPSEMRDLLREHWNEHDIGLPNGALDDQDGLAAIIRSTGGNFRLLERLLLQIKRILTINELTTVTLDVVEAARESLVIGTA